MARLPTVGGDAGNWGEILNDYLVQSHTADGLLKTDSVGAPQLKPSSVTSAALAPGAVTSAKIDKLGQAGGVATLDGSGKLPEANLPDRLSEAAQNAAAVGLHTQTVFGATTVPVLSGHTYEFTATANTTLTLTGADGAQVAVVATTGGFNFTAAGKALSGGTYVAHKVSTGWNIHPVGSATIIIAPGAAAPTISAVTTTTATATWAAVSTATGYNVRVNGGSTVNAGNVLTYTATGLPVSTAGTIEVQAYNAGGVSFWTSVGFTTATPTPVVIRLTTNHASVTESGNGTEGWNYAFASTPVASGAYSTLKLPANTDGFIEYTLTSITGTVSGGFIVGFGNAPSTNTAITPYTLANAVFAINGTEKHCSKGSGGTIPSAYVAMAGDRVRVGRTGTNLWLRVSRDAGATWLDAFSKGSYDTDGVTPHAPDLYAYATGSNATATITNIRTLNFS